MTYHLEVTESTVYNQIVLPFKWSMFIWAHVCKILHKAICNAANVNFSWSIQKVE